MKTLKNAATPTPAPSSPPLRRPRLTRRQAARERALKGAARNKSFDPLQYTLRAKAKRDKAADGNAIAAGPARDAAAPHRAADRTAAPLAPRPIRPLVLARPLVREGGEDYRQHPSRLTPQTREAYWAGNGPLFTTPSTARPAAPPARKPAA